MREETTMMMTWPTIHQGKLVLHPQALAIPTLPLPLATVLHHLATATALRRGFKVLLLLAFKVHPTRRLLSSPALMEEERKNKVSQRECLEHFVVHQALSKYSMARVEM